MSRTIWKYDLGIDQVAKIDIPADSVFRHAGIDPEGKLCAWVEVDNEFWELERHTFGIFMTGQVIPDDWEYCSTESVGKVVVHVYHYKKLEAPPAEEEES